MQSVARYARWQHEFDPAAKVVCVVFESPEGIPVSRPAFAHQPAALQVDCHGYEMLVPQGSPVTAVRFTPTTVGAYRYQALDSADAVVEQGTFVCELSDSPGYIERSPHDPRYLVHSDGSPYCSIGLNLCGPPRYPLPRGMAHFETAEAYATLGSSDYRRWFRTLASQGGNYARIWLSNPYFQVETETAGELDVAAFARLDAVVELARQYGIRLKLCFEHFRTFDLGSSFSRTLRHPQDGRSPKDVDEWFQQDAWRDLWLKKVRAYLARYGGDPTVMAWELWNENDCVQVSRWEIVRDWTRDMLREIKRLEPSQLVVNSLGSFDDPRKTRIQDDFHMEEMDFQQVHRYLDQGAPWEISALDPVALSVDAIQRARRPDRPILLAETGGVNDRHTGPFRYYRMDHRGILLHDTTYPAFFAGAAGSGHIWHWDSYVDTKDLWWHYKPLADLLRGMQLDREGFQPVDLSTESMWFLGLQGRSHFLGWVRNKQDSWHAVLRDEQEPEAIPEQVVDLASLGIRSGEVTVFWPWSEDAGRATLADGSLHLPSFRYGILIKIELA